MALIKCPECGNEISDTCETCVHCGYRLKPVAIKVDEQNKEEERIVLTHRVGKSSGSNGTAILLIVLGIFFVAAVFGIILIIVGAMMLANNSNTNNSNAHDCMYYLPSSNKILMYDVTDKEIKVDPYFVVDVKQENGHLKATVADVSGNIIYDLGACSTSEVNKCKESLEKIKKGTFKK